jgi:hypothetical protein
MEQLIETKFEKMGARAKIAIAFERPDTRAWNGRTVPKHAPQPIRVNVLRDDSGEYFEITHRHDVIVDVVDVRRADRHLLLLARNGGWLGDEQPSKFLCGHDERAWFVAAIPETASVSNVQDAKDALKPEAVWESIRAHGVPPHKRDSRRTKAFVRQGEWFFIPRSEARIDQKDALRDEPIRRGAGKAHTCQLMYRFGGEQVHVSRRYSNGLTTAEYRELSPSDRAHERWTTMRRGARVYVKGAIRHPDHKTIWLSDWHEVVMNTETRAKAMRHVAFLD